MDVTERQPLIVGEIVVHSHQLFPPAGRRAYLGVVERSGGVIGRRDQGEQRRYVIGIRSAGWYLVPGEGLCNSGNRAAGRTVRKTCRRAIKNGDHRTRRCRWAYLLGPVKAAKVPAALGGGRNSNVEWVRNSFLAPFLGPEKESLLLRFVVHAWDVDRPSNRVSEVVLLVAGLGIGFPIEIIAGVELVVAHELVSVSVELVGARFGLNFYCSRTAASILGAVIRGENFKLADGVEAGIHVERGVAPVIHVVAAIQFPIVIFGAAAIDAIADIPGHPHGALILPGLTAHTRDERYQLGEIAAIQLELGNFLAADRARQIGGLCFYLGYACALHYNFCTDSADLHFHIDASLLRDIESNPLGFEFLEALGSDRNVIRALAETSHEVVACGVGRRRAIDAFGKIAHRDLGIGDDGASAVMNCSSN